MSALPPPAPAIWAPRARKWMLRFLSRMDRRKVRKLSANNMTVLDVQWKARYTEWWDAGGWSTGAQPPDDTYRSMISNRRPAPVAHTRGD